MQRILGSYNCLKTSDNIGVKVELVTHIPDIHQEFIKMPNIMVMVGLSGLLITVKTEDNKTLKEEDTDLMNRNSMVFIWNRRRSVSELLRWSNWLTWHRMRILRRGWINCAKIIKNVHIYHLNTRSTLINWQTLTVMWVCMMSC